MNLELVIRPEAEADIAEAFDWYEKRVPGLGKKKGVTPAKAGVQKLLNRLDSRFRGNDNLGLL